MGEWSDNRRHARHERRVQKRAEAEARQGVRNQRTAQEQLTVLHKRGHGSCDEAFKLSALVNLADTPKPKPKKVRIKS